jgi:hypothetical protein
MQLTGARYTAVNRRITEGRVLRGGRRNSGHTKRARQPGSNGP